MVDALSEIVGTLAEMNTAERPELALERADPSEKNALLQTAKERLVLVFAMTEKRLGAALTSPALN
jgi:hypothetical protein